jgi:hypothetical protein
MDMAHNSIITGLPYWVSYGIVDISCSIKLDPLARKR